MLCRCFMRFTHKLVYWCWMISVIIHIHHLPLLIQRFLRNLVGMLTRKVSPWAVTVSWRLLPRLPVTYRCTGRGWRRVRGMSCLFTVMWGWLFTVSVLNTMQPIHTAHLHNLLVVCGRHKVSKDLLDNVFAFGGLWHYKVWASGSCASWDKKSVWGQSADKQWCTLLGRSTNNTWRGQDTNTGSSPNHKVSDNKLNVELNLTHTNELPVNLATFIKLWLLALLVS